MRFWIVLGLAILVTSCSHTMQISEEKIGTSRAKLTINANDLQYFEGIPFLDRKSVSVYLHKFPKCDGGKAIFEKENYLGGEQLTPDNYEKTIEIPAGYRLVILTNSSEFKDSQDTNCSNSVHFTPAEGAHYYLKLSPHSPTRPDYCNVLLLEKGPLGNNPITDVYYPKEKVGGLWKHSELNHCDDNA